MPMYLPKIPQRPKKMGCVMRYWQVHTQTHVVEYKHGDEQPPTCLFSFCTPPHLCLRRVVVLCQRSLGAS